MPPGRDHVGASAGGGGAAAGPSLDTSQFDGSPTPDDDNEPEIQAGSAGGSAGAGGSAAAGGSGGVAAATTGDPSSSSSPAPASSPPPLYHAAAVDQGLNLEPETLSYWGYDDGTSTLLVAKGGLVFAYDMSPGVPPPGSNPDSLRWTFPLAEGPAVRAMRLSLDGGLLALQRSPVMIEFVELATGNVFVQGTDRGRGEILTFFFTELEGSEVVLVTPGGLELMEFVTRRQGLRLRERIRLPVEWALYTHETRMVLLGTSGGGTPSGYIKAFQFVSSGLVALPPFTAGAAAAAAALMGAGGGGAAAAGLVAGSPVAAAAVATPPARVAADCLRLIKVYGRVYCAHINRRALRLELYRFYTDTVVLQHTYELFSPAVELAVVDSVIVAHCTASASGGGGGGGAEAGVAMLFDVAAPTLQPIANPLPVRIVRVGHAAPPTEAADAGAAADGGGGGGAAAAAAPAAAAAARRWEYLAPNVVLDRAGQTAFRLALNLQAVAESCSDPAIAVGFLQRRRGPAAAAAAAPAAAAAAAGGSAATAAAIVAEPSPKALLLSVVRNALQERMPMTTLRAIFDDLCAGYAAALDRELAALAAAAAAMAAAAAAGGGASSGGASGAASAALPPSVPPPPPAASVLMPQYVTADELASELFRWLHDEEVVDAPYLQAALYEYMSAAAAAGIPLPPYLQELSVEVLLQQAQDGQVLQLLYSQNDHLPAAAVQRLIVAQNTTTTTTGTGTTTGAAGTAADTAPVLAPAPGTETAAAAAAADADPEGAVGGSSEGPLPRQVGVDALARAALVDRYEPVAAAATSPSPGVAAPAAWLLPPRGAGAAAAAPAGAAAGTYVEALLASGDVLRAARVMRRYQVSRPSVKEFLAAVGARGDEAALAAVYRTFQDELLASYPKYDLAVRKVLASPQPPVQQPPPPPQPAAVSSA